MFIIRASYCIVDEILNVWMNPIVICRYRYFRTPCQVCIALCNIRNNPS
uniref:Uncharacterized protein n=1 Tax=Arundo donax TaxID=35708 RepID=A0A0A9BM33_ARUDO